MRYRTWLERKKIEKLDKRMRCVMSRGHLNAYRLCRKATEAETAALFMLSEMGYKVEAQKVFPCGRTPRIVDIYMTDEWIAIEIDGGYHKTKSTRRNDLSRAKQFQMYHPQVKFVRFTNEEVMGGEFRKIATERIGAIMDVVPVDVAGRRRLYSDAGLA